MGLIKSVSAKILSEYLFERGGKMSHLKLQKLLYYVQAYHLAYFDQPVIEEDFQAWLHGPVCRPVFDRFKDQSLLYTEFAFYSPPGEKKPSEILPAMIDEEQLDLIHQVTDGYAKLSADELERLTHGDAPWIDARRGFADEDRCSSLIPKESMRVFYKKFIYGIRER
jgi:uncharacterized phage-associated protein